MAFCQACGAEVSGAAFCPKCGASQTAGVAAPASVAVSSDGLAENVAGLLCYVLGWVTGIIFLLIDKRPFVKFHAAQSIVVFGGLTILRIGLGVVLSTGGLLGVGLWAAIVGLIGILALILWIFLMFRPINTNSSKSPSLRESPKVLPANNTALRSLRRPRRSFRVAAAAQRCWPAALCARRPTIHLRNPFNESFRLDIPAA